MIPVRIPVPLSTLSTALSLPISNRPNSHSPSAPHVIYRGSLMGFHHALDAAGVVNEVTVDAAEGMRVWIAGLIVEGGGMGGVMVREVSP